MLAAEKNNKRYKRDARLKIKGPKKTRRPKLSKNDIQGIGTKNSEERIKIRRKGANKNQRHNKINTCGKNRNTCNSNRIKTQKNKKKIKQIFKTKRIQKKGRLGQERTLKMNHQKFEEEGKNCTILWAEFANLGFGAASSIKKQANIITKADKIVNSKSGKGADFNKHRDILQQALSVNQCNDAARWRGVNTTGK